MADFKSTVGELTEVKNSDYSQVLPNGTRVTPKIEVSGNAKVSAEDVLSGRTSAMDVLARL